MDENFSYDLDAWLDAVADDRYEVERTLKDAAGEKTEVVYRCDGPGGTRVGPFVRKRFAQDAGRGVAYQQILDAQVSGVRLLHQPTIYECACGDDTLSAVMEFVRGRTLREVAEAGEYGRELFVRVAPALCDAVDELHRLPSQPIIHRDVKPSNVMLADDGRLVLIDLGIARAYREGAQHDTERYGTPGYAPPEQFGFGQTSEASDVYAIGMTLAFCLTGEDPAPALRETGFDDPRIPPALRPLLVRATQFDPAQRYGSARELGNAVSVALGASDVPDTANPTAVRTSVLDGRVPAVVGRVWNVVVLAVWALFAAALANGITHPVEGVSAWPMWVRVVTYVFAFVGPLSAIAYALMDRRRLPRLPVRHDALASLGLGALSLIVAMLIYLIYSMAMR
ncbi:MAG: serine/threonine-protein kinase [Coriobacteriales bacterium]|nr:serine/threonine-protein kinase [Coriobacteriales bacterium]